MRQILACLDGTDTSDQVAHCAESMAARMRCGLILLHILPDDRENIGLEIGEANVVDHTPVGNAPTAEHLTHLAERMTASGVETRAEVRRGYAMASILAAIEDLDPSIVVTGTHRHGLLHRLMTGSVTSGLLRHSDRPVVVVPTHQPDAQVDVPRLADEHGGTRPRVLTHN